MEWVQIALDIIYIAIVVVIVGTAVILYKNKDNRWGIAPSYSMRQRIIGTLCGSVRIIV